MTKTAKEKLLTAVEVVHELQKLVTCIPFLKGLPNTEQQVAERYAAYAAEQDGQRCYRWEAIQKDVDGQIQQGQASAIRDLHRWPAQIIDAILSRVMAELRREWFCDLPNPQHRRGISDTETVLSRFLPPIMPRQIAELQQQRTESKTLEEICAAEQALYRAFSDYEQGLRALFLQNQALTSETENRR